MTLEPPDSSVSPAALSQSPKNKQSQNQPQKQSQNQRSSNDSTPPVTGLPKQFIAALLALGTASLFWSAIAPNENRSSPELDGTNYPPLVMQDGDPYIRALMRTISASESNGPKPYSLLYGGEHFQDFSQHPDRCVPITIGINQGDCTTAAGRYQFITTTWEDQAERYHPAPAGIWVWRHYSFEPEFQDKVVYRWLSDPTAWNADLSTLLRQGQLQEVLQILSPTWTSLGYGIETNDMSDRLPQIYEAMLYEELGEELGRAE
ncbi:glycoside hydrolase family 24 protein [Leptolyngbya ohadii]|uniref:glycoside hydrolase family 24 protein n=1 Tax=Leptolyngbya ohadii TaxID=1962290 RepID=UPI001CEDBA63|nr:glycoside hydrolase family protein [Leptolyngbya ohadii]